MKITLYQNVSERNQMDKTLTKVKDIDGKFKQSTNIMSPILVLSYATLPDFNYIYIEELARYYFVDSITSINEGLWQINCSEDVLKTYKTGIRNLDAYVERNENVYSNDIPDKYVLTSCKKYYEIIPTDYNSNLFNYTSFLTNAEETEEPNLSSETNSFCYAVSFANLCLGDPTVTFNDDQILVAPYGLAQINFDYDPGTNEFTPVNGTGQFNANAFTKIYAINNNNFQALGSLLAAQITDSGSDRMYSNVSSMINSLRVYPFSIPQYYKMAGINEQSLPKGNFLDNDVYPYRPQNDDSKNIDIVTIGSSKINNVITYSKQGETGALEGRGGARYLSGWELPAQTTTAIIGVININGLHGNFLDYEPYTKLHLYVPFFGYIELQTTAVMNKQIQLRLSVDFITGVGTLYITTSIVNGETGQNKFTIIDIKTAQLGTDLPLGTTNMNEMKIAQQQKGWNTGIEVFMNLLSTAMIYGMAPINPATGGIVAGAKMAVGLGLAKGVGTALQGIVDYNFLGKTPITTTIKGNTSGSGFSNFTAPKGIYILRETVDPYNTPSDYKKYIGRPLEKNKKLSSLYGFTKVGSVHIQGNEFAKATEEEKEAIEDVLKSGVILPKD